MRPPLPLLPPVRPSHPIRTRCVRVSGPARPLPFSYLVSTALPPVAACGKLHPHPRHNPQVLYFGRAAGGSKAGHTGRRAARVAGLLRHAVGLVGHAGLRRWASHAVSCMPLRPLCGVSTLMFPAPRSHTLPATTMFRAPLRHVSLNDEDSAGVPKFSNMRIVCRAPLLTCYLASLGGGRAG